ncbi:helix-turn-helix domain-containing protein [Mycobacterium sp. MUNTM1]
MGEITRRLVPIPDARTDLGNIGHTTLYELVKRSKLEKVNIGRRSFITAKSLDSYIDSLTADGELEGNAAEGEQTEELSGAALLHACGSDD